MLVNLQVYYFWQNHPKKGEKNYVKIWHCFDAEE